MTSTPGGDRRGADRPPEGIDGIERLAWCVAAALTIWALAFHLGTIPDGCYHDEVSIGFNARSIWRTGVDQYGVPFPLYYRGIGDWKGPLPLYAIMLSTAVLGNTPVALRVPGLIFAAGMAALLGCCIRALTRDRRLALWLALFSLWIPSIFFYARSGTAEPACFPFFTTLAIFAVLGFELEPTRQRAAAAGALLALGAYAYPAARLFMPTAAAAAVICFALHPPTRKYVSVMVAAGIAAAIPMAVFMARHPDALLVRLRGMSIFSPNASHVEVAELFASNYLSHFGLDFLFRTGQKGHHHWHNIGTGFISLWMLFPLVFGVMVLVRERQRPFYRFLLLVLLAAPIPAAMTTDDVPHPNRIIHLVPILVLVCALGVEHLLARLRPGRRTIAALLALMSFEGAAMANQYFTEFPHVFDGDNPGGSDHGMGTALRLAFAERRPGAPMYLPPEFFDFDGMLVGFWGDLDPKEMRAHGPAGSGIHSTDEPGARDRLPAGTLWIAEGAGVAPFDADVAAAVERRPDSGGGRIWTIYRKR
jgi:4-amino-4-deoxy-L-arabinose transferase-like glycosyltransferase